MWPGAVSVWLFAGPTATRACLFIVNDFVVMEILVPNDPYVRNLPGSPAPSALLSIVLHLLDLLTDIAKNYVARRGSRQNFILAGGGYAVPLFLT